MISTDSPPVVPPSVRQILVQCDRPVDAAQVRRLVPDALAYATRRLLAEGIIASAQDIDACMLLGAGWPALLGGMTPWRDRTAAPDERRFLLVGVASVAPSTV